MEGDVFKAMAEHLKAGESEKLAPCSFSNACMLRSALETGMSMQIQA